MYIFFLDFDDWLCIRGEWWQRGPSFGMCVGQLQDTLANDLRLMYINRRCCNSSCNFLREVWAVTVNGILWHKLSTTSCVSLASLEILSSVASLCCSLMQYLTLLSLHGAVNICTCWHRHNPQKALGFRKTLASGWSTCCLEAPHETFFKVCG